MMRWRVAGATLAGKLKARETVIGATSARRATSLTPIRFVWRVLFRFTSDMGIRFYPHGPETAM